MGGNDQSHHLNTALSCNDDFAARGFVADCGPTGGVAISRGGHARGVWHYTNGSFYWTPAGNSAPVARVRSVRETVEHTMNYIATA